jgi:hypothetical protein
MTQVALLLLLLHVMQHPDAAGDWQASTLGVAYDWSTGKLSSHRYSWQKAAVPLEAPPEDLTRVLLPAVTPPSRDRLALWSFGKNGCCCVSEKAIQPQ